jgi:DtxR family Mn-dependent transcriptional regulator
MLIKISYMEENYLKAIYKLSETSKEETPTNAIAERLEVKAGSVTDIL